MKHKTDERVYLREWRLAKGLTQPELAKRTGTVKSEISRLEKGSRRMTIEWMNAFSRALGVSIDDLMTVPPMGFGAVSPPPKMSGDEDDGDNAVAQLGDLSVSIPATSHGFVTVTGDDWIGTYAPGDVLIYDKSKTSTAAPGVFAFEIGGEQVVRRVSPGKAGAMLSCANTAYPPVPMGKYGVLGRVVARIQRV